MSKSPVHLFIEYFVEASLWGVDAILAAPPSDKETQKILRVSLNEADGQKSYDLLKAYVKGNGEEVYAKIAVLSAIDSFLQLIHPRTVKSFSEFEEFSIGHWLYKLRAHRSNVGFYCENDEYYLLARGPLARGARDQFASSAFVLSDMFAFLSLAPKTLFNDCSPISVCVKRVNLSLASGIAPAEPGDESVAFIPVAEDGTSLTPVSREVAGRKFVDFKLAQGFDAPKVINEALSAIGFADIVMAPELVVSETDAGLVSKNLALEPGRLRILLAGSGNTIDKAYEKPWNQATLMNGIGSQLIKQRKVWQAGLDKKRAEKFKIQCPKGSIVFEDNCAGSEVHILDVDGFGRCVILICQDFQAKPMTDDLVRLYQPDWVFIPILDTGVSAGRWVHQRAYELSAVSPARFLVSSSTALAAKLGYKDYACGMAIGPKDDIGPDAGRVCALAYQQGKPGFGRVTWRSGWGITSVGMFQEE